MHAIVLCDIQACGKSTYAMQHWFHSHVRLSLDLLRTRQREAALPFACLAAKIDFVIDNTNPLHTQRIRYLQLARTAAQRVPDIAIHGTLAKLEVPLIEEGWDRLVIVRTTGETSYETEETKP